MVITTMISNDFSTLKYQQLRHILTCRGIKGDGGDSGGKGATGPGSAKLLAGKKESKKSKQ